MFGLSFGTSKKSSTSDSTITKAENVKQQQSESTQQSQTSSTSGISNTSNTSAGTSATSQNQTQAQTNQSQQSTTGTQSSFSDSLKGGLEGAIGQLLGLTGSNTAELEKGIAKLDSFDADEYVANVVSQAQAKENATLEQSINGLYDSLGGTASSNSMGALLAQRLTSDSNANIAGIRGQAEANAQGIQSSNLKAVTDAIGSQSALIPAMVTALKGGNVETTGSTLASEIANLTGNTSGVTKTSETSQQQQETQQSTVSSLVGLVQQLLNSQTNTTGTEHTTGTEKKSGGGLSLGF